jgi:hypothetical protein
MELDDRPPFISFHHFLTKAKRHLALGIILLEEENKKKISSRNKKRTKKHLQFARTNEKDFYCSLLEGREPF